MNSYISDNEVEKKYIPNASSQNEIILKKQEYDDLVVQFKKDNIGTWKSLALKNIIWEKQFSVVLNDKDAPFYKWFEDGRLSVSYNCIDKNLAHNSNKIAFISINSDGNATEITYKQLHEEICKLANGLLSLGLNKGDKVVIYLPHSVEAIVAMHACIRIGVIHSVVFAGFSAKALSDRIKDLDASVIITSNAHKRGEKVIIIKDIVDEALSYLNDNNKNKTVVVFKNLEIAVNINNNIDIWWHDLIKNKDITCKPVVVESEHPLFILYTSGSTGKPKGIVHSSAGYLLGVINSLKLMFSVKQDDVYWCTADVGWITGHSYCCYGPLALGLTQVLFEGIPTYPDISMYWQIIQKYKVSVLYTAPTVIRLHIKLNSTLPQYYNLSSLRTIGVCGEPIDPETWKWLYSSVGNNSCNIVDTWWQTETGSVVVSPVPLVTELKAGSCTFPLPGIEIGLVDDNGMLLTNPSKGYLVIKNPFPSQIRGIWNDKDRYEKIYYPKKYNNNYYYLTGDSARIDQDGYCWIIGRTDDVLNVSAHRLGSMEIESVVASHSMIAECAVVGVYDEIKGQAIYLFVVCKKNIELNNKEVVDNLIIEINTIVSKNIGPIAKPDYIKFCDGLPKTRSGKIMRRLLKDIANGVEITQDTSTLEDQNIINLLNCK